MSDKQDNCKEFELEVLIILKELKYGDMILNMALMKILDLMSKQREELVEKVEKIDFKQGYTEESQPIFEHGQIEARDQVIALIKDTNEVVEEEEKNK